MIDIEHDGFSYRILSNAEVERIIIEIESKAFIIYKCSGSRSIEEREDVITMLFIKSADEGSLIPHLAKMYCNVEKICDHLPEDYSDNKFHVKYREDHIVSKELCLYIIVANAKKQPVEAEPISETPDLPEADEYIQELCQETNGTDNQASDTEDESSSIAKPNIYKKKIVLIVCFLLTFATGYAIIKLYNRLDNEEFSSGTSSVTESAIPSTQTTEQDTSQGDSTEAVESDVETTMLTTEARFVEITTLTTETSNLDFNNDGSIDSDDYALLLEKQFLLQINNLDQEELETIQLLIEILDTDKDGSVSTYEWEDFTGQ